MKNSPVPIPLPNAELPGCRLCSRASSRRASRISVFSRKEQRETVSSETVFSDLSAIAVRTRRID